MDVLFAKTRGRKGSYYKVLTDNTVFPEIIDFSHSRPYKDEYKLEDDEWFVVDKFTEQDYCTDFVKNNLVVENYSFLAKDNYCKISHIISIQKDENVYIFQNITPSLLYKKQKLLSFDNILHSTEQAVLIKEKNILVIKEYADCYFIKDKNKLYFKYLSSITSIFPGIDVLYKEATNDEVENFLKLDMITLSPTFTSDMVKTANRRRIKEAIDRYNHLNKIQKAEIPGYINTYCPSLYDNNTKKVNITNETSLTDFLNILNQRYYTTELDSEKRLANSVTKL